MAVLELGQVSKHHNNSCPWSQCSSMKCQQFYPKGYFALSNSGFLGVGSGWPYKTKENDIKSPKVSLKTFK